MLHTRSSRRPSTSDNSLTRPIYRRDGNWQRWRRLDLCYRPLSAVRCATFRRLACEGCGEFLFKAFRSTAFSIFMSLMSSSSASSTWSTARVISTRSSRNRPISASASSSTPPRPSPCGPAGEHPESLHTRCSRESAAGHRDGRGPCCETRRDSTADRPSSQFSESP